MEEEEFHDLEEKLGRRFQGYPLLIKQFDFMKNLKKKEKNFYNALQLMDGSKGLVDISRESGLAYAPLIDFVANLVGQGYVIFVDDNTREIYNLLGRRGIEAYNLINNRRTFDEIVESSGIEPENMKRLIESSDNIENKGGVIRFKDEGTDTKAG
jgi:hypothetical protein